MTLILQLRIELDFKSMVEFNLAEVESGKKRCRSEVEREYQRLAGLGEA